MNVDIHFIVNPLVLKTVLIMLYIMVGVVIAGLRFINDVTISSIGQTFGWGGGTVPALFYLLYVPFWPLYFVAVLCFYLRSER